METACRCLLHRVFLQLPRIGRKISFQIFVWLSRCLLFHFFFALKFLFLLSEWLLYFDGNLIRILFSSGVYKRDTRCNPISCLLCKPFSLQKCSLSILDWYGRWQCFLQYQIFVFTPSMQYYFLQAIAFRGRWDPKFLSLPRIRPSPVPHPEPRSRASRAGRADRAGEAGDQG